jgi:hypothetical protein
MNKFKFSIEGDYMDQMEQQPERRDVSKQTLIVLVILALMVSLLGTITVVRETSNANKVIDISDKPKIDNSASGKISLTVIDGNGESTENKATGFVTFEVI